MEELEELEGLKLQAEIEQIKADIEKTKAEAAKAHLETSEAQRKDAELKASDLHNHVYRFNGTVDSKTIDAAVKKLTEWHRLDPVCDIEIIFNSGGGSVTDGFILFDYLRYLSTQGHKIITGCTGMAASMAGILMMAGDYRWASKQCWFMIHRVAFGAVGQTQDIEDKVEWIKRVEERVLDIFVSNSNMTRNKLKKSWERKDYFLNAEEVLEYGLVHEIRG